MATRSTESPVLSWRAPEFYFYKKESRWFTFVWAAAVLLTFYFLFFRGLDWTAALLVLAAATALYRLGSRRPRQLQVTITGQGVTIGEETLPFDRLSSFHLTNHGEYTTLEFQRKGGVRLPFSALIGDQNRDSLRTILGRYLPEKNTGTAYINDFIGRLMRF